MEGYKNLSGANAWGWLMPDGTVPTESDALCTCHGRKSDGHKGKGKVTRLNWHANYNFVVDQSDKHDKRARAVKWHDLEDPGEYPCKKNDFCNGDDLVETCDGTHIDLISPACFPGMSKLESRPRNTKHKAKGKPPMSIAAAHAETPQADLVGEILKKQNWKNIKMEKK